MKRSGSTGGRGFVGWVAMVLVVALLVGPALQEPTQLVMAQANPAPAAKPVLDISGIAEIQSIPAGKRRVYDLKETLEELEIEGDIPLEHILTSIANLAIMQMGLAGRDKFNVYRNEESLPEGTFGWVLQEILGIDPKRDFGLSVEHMELRETALGKKDCYKLTINYLEIEVILRDFGVPQYLRQEYGYEWGIAGLVLTQYSEKKDAHGIPYTEEKELAIHQVEDKQNPGKYKFVAIYTVRILAPDGTLVGWEQWEFAQGNPNAVWHRPMGPP